MNTSTPFEPGVDDAGGGLVNRGPYHDGGYRGCGRKLWFGVMGDGRIALDDEDQAFADIGAMVSHALQFVGDP